MKISKTLLFMVRNPTPFIVYLTCWFFYAVLCVVSEDPFTDKSWPGIVWLAKTSFSNLPWSLENFAIIVSTIFDDIVKEAMKDEGWIIFTPFAFIMGYREARGNLKGIAKERQTWMQWYDQQQEVMRGNDTLEEPPSKSEATQIDSYFRKAQRTVLLMVRNPMLFIPHFICWLLPFFVVVVIEWSHVIETTRDLVKFVPYFVMSVAIPTFLTSYQETRGTVKGIAKEAQVWTKWYQRQINAIAQGHPLAAPPPSLDIY